MYHIIKVVSGAVSAFESFYSCAQDMASNWSKDANASIGEEAKDDISCKVEQSEDFQFLIEAVYKIGGIGIVLGGKVQCGEIDTRTEPWLVLKRTGRKVQVKAATFMHQTVTDDDYWVRQRSEICGGSGGGITIKTNISVQEFVEGDLLQLTTPPLPKTAVSSANQSRKR